MSTQKSYRILAKDKKFCNNVPIYRQIRDTNIFNFPVPPMFWIPSQLEGAFVGQDVTLECNSEAFPLSINYWTKKNGEMLISGGAIQANSESRIDLYNRSRRLESVT